MQDILKYDHGVILSGPGNNGTDVKDQISQIIDDIEHKYNTVVDDDGNVLGNESGPTIPGEITGIPDDLIHDVDENGNIITDNSGSEGNS